MKDMIYFELKKILHNKSTMFIILAALVFNLFIFFVFDVLEEIAIYMDGDNVQQLNNFSAISYKRENIKEFSGLLTDEKILDIANRVAKIKNNPDNYDDTINTTETSKQQQLMRGSGFTEEQIANAPPIMSMKQEVHWGELERLRTINGVIVRNYTDVDGNIIPTSSTLSFLDKPMHYDYYDGWYNLINRFSRTMGLILLIVIIICIAPIFSDEYNKGIDSIILTARYGKSKVISAKILSAIIFTPLLFIFFGSLNFCLYSLGYGLSGASSNIQINAFFSGSTYAINFLELYLITLGFVFLGMMFLTVITLWISSQTRSSFATAILSGLILFIPAINLTDISSIIQRIFDLFPGNMMNTMDIFEEAIYYNFFGINIQQPYLMVVAAMVGSVIVLPLAYQSFRRHQV